MVSLPQELSTEMVVSLLVALCVAVIFTAVIIDFILFSSQRRVRREQRSLVDTATMTGFFVFFYLILQSGRGYVLWPSDLTANLSMFIGLLMVISGCAANLAGRFSLGGNWANHIKIYEGHQLVKSGIYKLIRHPLYASIIMMFYGACLVYLNLLALAAVTLIFVPFMVYRARQEEALLEQQFAEYKQYQRETGMFFPRIITKEVKR